MKTFIVSVEKYTVDPQRRAIVNMLVQRGMSTRGADICENQLYPGMDNYEMWSWQLVSLAVRDYMRGLLFTPINTLDYIRTLSNEGWVQTDNQVAFLINQEVGTFIGQVCHLLNSVNNDISSNGLVAHAAFMYPARNHKLVTIEIHTEIADANNDPTQDSTYYL